MVVGGGVRSGLASVFHLVLCAGSEVLSLEGQRLTAVFHAGLSDILSKVWWSEVGRTVRDFLWLCRQKE